MLNFKLDLSEVVRSTQMTKGQFQAIAQDAVEALIWEVYNQIHREANGSLSSTRAIYKANINRPQIGNLKGTIVLTGRLPNMLEQGTPPWDMKDVFAQSANVKQSKDGGWYAHIPFRHATPGSLGDSEAFSSQMPDDVYRMVRGMDPQKTAAFGGKEKSGERFSVESGKGTKHVRPRVEGGDLSEEQRRAYTAKAPLEEGMIREEKDYEAASQSTYTTFRTISSNSPANAWIHPGFEARDLMPKAWNSVNVGNIVANAVDHSMKKNLV